MADKLARIDAGLLRDIEAGAISPSTLTVLRLTDAFRCRCWSTRRPPRSASCGCSPTLPDASPTPRYGGRWVNGSCCVAAAYESGHPGVER
jgi:hypothetical protein